jgi:hypothetical protein
MSLSGADTEIINISTLKITPCKACLNCMHKNPGICIQNDDMNIIYSCLKKADTLVFATPVYLDGMTAQLKAVIDRCVCCMEPFIVKDASGRTRHSFSWKMPENFILVSTCGFPETETFNSLTAGFRALAANMNAKLTAEFCIPGSIAIQMSPDSLTKKLVLLESAGKEYAAKGSVSINLIEEINQPVFSNDEYFMLAEKYENWCREKLNK